MIEVKGYVETQFRETELGLIPTDWDVAPLDEICWEHKQTVNPNDHESMPYVGLEHITPGTPRLTTWGDSGEVTSSKTLFHKDHILYGKLRPYLDKAVVAPVEGICSTDIIVLSVRERKTTPDFMVNLLHTGDFLAFATSTMTGVNHPRTHWSSLKRYPIALPPLPEQHRIAGVLNAIQNEIAIQDDIIASAKDFKRSLMLRLFTFGIGEQPTETKMTEIGEVPAHWNVALLDTVVTSTQYGLNERAEVSGQYPILRMNNLSEGKVITQDLKYVDLDEETLARYKLKVGDILFNRTNSYELVGKTSLFEQTGDFVFASYLVRVETDQETLIPAFLNYLMNSEQVQARLRQLATRGVSQSNISPTKLRTLIIAYPPTIAEQAEIVTLLQNLDAKIAAEEDREAALQNFFKTMLHQLMTGQIRLLSDEGLPL